LGLPRQKQRACQLFDFSAAEAVKITGWRDAFWLQGLQLRGLRQRDKVWRAFLPAFPVCPASQKSSLAGPLQSVKPGSPKPEPAICANPSTCFFTQNRHLLTLFVTCFCVDLAGSGNWVIRQTIVPKPKYR
jgi:hypothetical protein